MEFGISTGRADTIDQIAHAESLGFSRVWVTDSPFIRAHMFVTLAVAALRSQKIKLGTGVAVAGMRLAPDVACGVATLNRLAPGRIFCCVGTGNTAMRMMGQPPMRIGPFRDYLRVLRGLLRGEAVDYTLDGSTHSVQFLLPEQQFVALEPPVPLHVAANGPRAQALAGEFGDGLVTGIPRGSTVPEALANVRRGAERAGRSLEGFHTAALMNVVMLEPGEALTSARVVAEVGPAIMTNVHYLVDWVRETGREPPPFVRPIWNDYMRFVEGLPAQNRHQVLHQNHYNALHPDEARFITPEIIRNFCLAGPPEALVEQIRELERQGLNQITFTPPAGQWFEVIERFARRVMDKL